MKKKIFIISLIVLILILITLVLLGLFKGDNFFLLSQKISSSFQSADVKKVNVDYNILTPKELKELPYVRFDDSLLLINRDFPLSNNENPVLDNIDNHKLSKTISAAYQQLVDAVYQRYEKKLCIRSAYRTEEEQKEIVGTLPSDIAAPVGTSEHQSGLSLDVYIEGSVGGKINHSKAGRYVTTQGYQYGFIVRYPHGKQDITGITYEPWHFRFVGIPHAEIITKNSLTLEEYITDFYQDGAFYEYGDYIISRQEMSATLRIPSNCESVLISEDNTGHYIITAKKVSIS